jgi:2-polyprenyl-6-methoxyphenol hydroxylase-like FAD-dependent oxidoreductase
MKKHFKVVVIGGGPVGSLLSKLLSQYGVQHCLIEKRFEPTKHPQAHYLNARSMEILKSHFPSIHSSIIESMPNSDNWR